MAALPRPVRSLLRAALGFVGWAQRVLVPPWCRACLGRYAAGVLQALPTAALVAAVVHLGQDLVAPMELALQSLVHGAAVDLATRADQGPAPRLRPGVIRIDAAQFHGEFRERSPLDRCVLADWIKRELGESRVASLTIDLDLSPTRVVAEALYGRAKPPDAATKAAVAVATASGSAASAASSQPASADMPAEAATVPQVDLRDQVCQLRLDKELRRDGNAKRLVLLMPGASSDEQHQLWTQQWVLDSRDAGIRFGHGQLIRRFGLVASYPRCEAGVPAIGLLTAHLLGRVPSTGPSCSGPGALSPGTAPIRWTGLLALDTVSAAASSGDGPRHLMLGAGYSVDDLHVTPLGPLLGVDIHAAIADEPHTQDLHLLSFCVDLVLGAFVFAPVFHGLWGAYFHVLRGQPSLSELLIPVGMVVVGMGLLLGLVLLSAWVLLVSNKLLNVGAMAAGMAVDAAVVSALGSARHAIAPHHPGSWRPTWAKLPQRPVQWLRSVVWCLVVVPVVVQIASHHG